MEIPERDCEMLYAKRVCRFKGLDHHQEALARKFESGHPDHLPGHQEAERR